MRRKLWRLSDREFRTTEPPEHRARVPSLLRGAPGPAKVETLLASPGPAGAVCVRRERRAATQAAKHSSASRSPDGAALRIDAIAGDDTREKIQPDANS